MLGGTITCIGAWRNDNLHWCLNVTKLLFSGAVEAGQLCISMCAGAKMESCSALNPVDVGACHGMTLDEIREKLGSACLEVRFLPTCAHMHVAHAPHVRAYARGKCHTSVCAWLKFVYICI